MAKKSTKRPKNIKQESTCVCDSDKSPFIAIPSALMGIFLVIVGLIIFFGRDLAIYIPNIVWAFVVIGVVAMFFAYKRR